MICILHFENTFSGMGSHFGDMGVTIWEAGYSGTRFVITGVLIGN